MKILIDKEIFKVSAFPCSHCMSEFVLRKPNILTAAVIIFLKN